MTEKVGLELTYAGETYHSKVTLRSQAEQEDVLTYELVVDKVHELFPQLNGNWTLVYRDDEGDVVTLAHAMEFAEACRVLLEKSPEDDKDKQLPSLHFYVLSRISLREKVVEKVVELARLAGQATQQLRKSELLGRGRESIARLAGGAVTHAGVAFEHIRNSEILGRGRDSLGSSAAHTRTLLLSARSGVSTRLRRASSVMSAELERRRLSSGSSDSGEGLFDAAEFVKSPISSPTEVTMTVDLRQSIASATSEAAGAEQEARGEEDSAADTTEIVEEEQTAYESDADTLCDDEEDREWDIVDSSTTEDAIAETDSQWASEIDVIRGILVHVDEELCCELLSQHNGNVEAVLVELTNVTSSSIFNTKC
ncbi:hypothetical protein BBO99_00000709 [Phytophthora kernoviae]|uniref:PB1 domain-containing protein n=2 Tax=Phytophthora kernoviae TaxID=325452 RepID=A0A3R7H2Y0_9STRA|nr:hypothetical protein G195_003201 [Phytophthora kernoviae 00238/432]KAG2524678.1 hypothetical protein JM16_004527 [Phytophthora kernoviae]RLN85219.1 hypothetical protein BBO99_00000709 [Phytophthora kernoviae]